MSININFPKPKFPWTDEEKAEFEMFRYSEFKLEKELSFQDAETGEELPKDIKKHHFKLIDYDPRKKKYIAQTRRVINGRYYKVYLEPHYVRTKLGKKK